MSETKTLATFTQEIALMTSWYQLVNIWLECNNSEREVINDRLRHLMMNATPDLGDMLIAATRVQPESDPESMIEAYWNFQFKRIHKAAIPKWFLKAWETREQLPTRLREMLLEKYYATLLDLP